MDILQKSGYFYKLKSEIWTNRKTFKIHLVVASMRFTSKTRINFKSKSSRLFPQRKFSRTLQNFGNAQLHAGKSFEIAATLAQGKLTVTNMANQLIINKNLAFLPLSREQLLK